MRWTENSPGLQPVQHVDNVARDGLGKPLPLAVKPPHLLQLHHRGELLHHKLAPIGLQQLGQVEMRVSDFPVPSSMIRHLMSMDRRLGITSRYWWMIFVTVVRAPLTSNCPTACVPYWENSSISSALSPPRSKPSGALQVSADDVGQAAGIAVAGCHEHLGDPLAQLVVDPANHPAVEHSHLAAGQHQDVPGVGVGMVETVAKDHLHEYAGPAAGQLVAVDVTGGAGPAHRPRSSP